MYSTYAKLAMLYFIPLYASQDRRSNHYAMPPTVLPL